MEFLSTLLNSSPTLLATFKLFGVKLIDGQDFAEMAVRFGLNLLFAIILIRGIYYRTYKERLYLFTLFVFNTVTFFICILLGNVKLSIGFAFGLFAIFSILRFRSDTIPLPVMTYLFIAIAIAVINSLANKKISYAELMFTNIMLVGLAYSLEFVWLRKRESVKSVLYEKIDLIKPENYDDLLADLKERTGLNVHRAEIANINFLRDVAKIRIYYYEESHPSK